MTRNQIQHYKERYPPGTEIILDNMSDDPHPIPSGSKGVVNFVDDIGTLHCTFENGRKLGICPEIDSFRKIAGLQEAQEFQAEEELSQTM